jgi:hypothetical protein
MSLTECYDVTCHNEASGSKGFRGKLCRMCKISGEQFTLPCVTCKGTFTKMSLNSKMPLYCSNYCRDRAGYNRRRTKQLDSGKVKPKNTSIIYTLMKRRSNISMLSEKTGYSKSSIPTMIHRLKKEGWNIKNYHGYFELEEDL